MRSQLMKSIKTSMRYWIPWFLGFTFWNCTPQVTLHSKTIQTHPAPMKTETKLQDQNPNEIILTKNAEPDMSPESTSEIREEMPVFLVALEHMIQDQTEEEYPNRELSIETIGFLKSRWEFIIKGDRTDRIILDFLTFVSFNSLKSLDEDQKKSLRNAIKINLQSIAKRHSQSEGFHLFADLQNLTAIAQNLPDNAMANASEHLTWSFITEVLDFHQSRFKLALAAGLPTFKESNDWQHHQGHIAGGKLAH